MARHNGHFTNKDLNTLLVALGFQPGDVTEKFRRVWRHPEAGTTILLPSNKMTEPPLEVDLVSLRTHLDYNGRHSVETLRRHTLCSFARKSMAFSISVMFNTPSKTCIAECGNVASDAARRQSIPSRPRSDRTPMTENTDSQFLRRLRLLSFVEGTSTLVLFGIAMPLKYFAGMPLAVRIVGSLHGVLFVGLVIALLLAIRRVPISKGLAAAGMVAAVFPFGPFVFDRWLVDVHNTD